MNREEHLSFRVSAETKASSRELLGIEPGNRATVGRRSFIRGLGIVGATLLPASALLLTQRKARAQSSGSLTKGDADLLRFAAWVEIVERAICGRNTMSLGALPNPT